MLPQEFGQLDDAIGEGGEGLEISRMIQRRNIAAAFASKGRENEWTLK